MTYYSINEIKKHNTINDCWIYANDNVYDITNFIKIHPGGSNCLLKKAGTDCSYDFEFHSKNGKKIWDRYKIGKIKKKYKKKKIYLNRFFCFLF
jgi:cytochrome b involved in lipid metabolism